MLKPFLVFLSFIILLLFDSLALYAKTTNCDLARIYVAEGRYDSDYYKKAIELCSGYIRPYELLGNEYRKKNEIDKAIDLFTKAADLGSANYKLYFHLANLLYDREDIDFSFFYLKKALKIKPDYEKSLELIDKIRQKIDSKGPNIFLYEPIKNRTNRVSYFYESFTVRGKVVDQSQIASLTVNKKPIKVQFDGSFLIDVPLKYGNNEIFVEAVDELRNRSKVKSVIHRATAITDNRLYNKSYAVIIGINNYDYWPKLGFALSDAFEIKKLFEKSGFDNITTILDKDATQRRILTELYTELPEKVDRDDRVVFYFAGHGMTIAGLDGIEKGYIIPVESGLTNYPITAISMRQILNLTKRISAKHIFFIMDCCYSGNIIMQGKKVIRNTKNDNIRKMSTRRVIQIITAGDKDQMALESEGHGIFTKYILNSLKGNADLNGDSVISGTELGTYVPPIISKITQRFQTPLFAHLEGNGDIIFFIPK